MFEFISTLSMIALAKYPKMRREWGAVDVYLSPIGVLVTEDTKTKKSKKGARR